VSKKEDDMSPPEIFYKVGARDPSWPHISNLDQVVFDRGQLLELLVVVS
jgi:hypothetical protein